jgi:hypothetical protein
MRPEIKFLIPLLLARGEGEGEESSCTANGSQSLTFIVFLWTRARRKGTGTRILMRHEVKFLIPLLLVRGESEGEESSCTANASQSLTFIVSLCEREGRLLKP